MPINDDNLPDPAQGTPAISPGTYSPVTVYMQDTLGIVFLGILASVLLLGWMRAEMRYRYLMARTSIYKE